MNLLENFAIEVDDIRNYGIIGIDPGAGDWSAAKALVESGELDKTQGIVNLYVSNQGNMCKDASVLYHFQEKWHIGVIAVRLAENTGASGVFFENFKLPPTSAGAKACYGNNFNNPTYLELMKRNFQCIVECLFNPAVNNFREEKFILFVGRPSSDDWKQDELKYRELLCDGLKVPGVKRENIQMAIVSEAQAAMASEVYETGLDTDKVTVIVDVGSSTVDVIVVQKGGRQVGEFSRQIGAGNIEANMLELALYDDCDPENVVDNMKPYFSEDSEYQKILSYRKKLRIALKTKPYLESGEFKEFKFSKIAKYYKKLVRWPSLERFDLRNMKENYFGPDGVNGKKKQSPEIEFEGGREFSLKVRDRLMEKAIYEMPIFVPCTEQRYIDNPYKRSYLYRSYYDALVHFFDGVRELFAISGKPQVIVTGGAGVMPFVKELIREKLGVEPSMSNHPSYTVSRGLAYIGYAEIKKCEELKAINNLIDEALKENEWDLRYDVKSSMAHFAVNKLIEDFAEWGENGWGVSLNDAVFKIHAYTSKDLGEILLVKKWWENKIKSQIVASIQSRFSMLYKNAKVEYKFSIDPQIVENAYQKGSSTTVRYDWDDLVGWWSSLWIDSERTDYSSEKRQEYVRKVRERRSKLEENVRGQQEVIDLAAQHTAEILDGFRRELRKDVEKYVEGLTPYIIRQ